MTTPKIRAAAIPGTVRTMIERPGAKEVPEFEFDGAPQLAMMTTTAITRGRYRGNNLKRTNGALEILPSVAHVASDDFKRPVVAEATRGRYKVVLDEHGHTLAVCHTNGASHATKIEAGGRYSRDLYTQHMLDKSFALGRIDTAAGCLVRQLKDGTVNARTIVARELVGPKAKVCAKDAASCPHLETEKKARQAKNVERMAALEVKHGAADEAKDARLAAAIATALAKVSK